MKEIPNRYDKTEQGLHKRYKVTKIGAEEVEDPKAQYFVLRIDGYGDDTEHLLACQEAALTFAAMTPNRRLAMELVQLVAHHRGVLASRSVAESYLNVKGD